MCPLPGRSAESSGLNFDEIFGAEQGDISIEKLEEMLEKALAAEASKQDVSPNALVRIVHDGEVIWVTSSQAAEFLQETSASGEEASLKKNVERALKGDRKLLRQELRLLLAMAKSTFERYREGEKINAKVAERTGLALDRRENEINTTFEQLDQVEIKIEAYRQKQPVIAKYEEQMGALLNAQQVGDLDTARNLAGQLAQDKRQYVLLSRALQPDVNESYFNRLEGQKTKKKILGTQQVMVSGRGENLKVELKQIQGRYKQLGSKKGDAANAAQVKEEMQQTKQAFDERAHELKAVQQESKVIARQEAETDAVVSHIAENVLGDTELAVDMDKQKQQMSQKKSTTKAPAAAPPKKKSIGMATTGRR